MTVLMPALHWKSQKLKKKKIYIHFNHVLIATLHSDYLLWSPVLLNV